MGHVLGVIKKNKDDDMTRWAKGPAIRITDTHTDTDTDNCY